MVAVVEQVRDALIEVQTEIRCGVRVECGCADCGLA